MSVKIYAIIWAFIAVVAAFLVVTGNFSNLTAVVFGFVSFGMVFMGMMNVLPLAIAHPAPKKEKTAKVSAEREAGGFVRSPGQVHAH